MPNNNQSNKPSTPPDFANWQPPEGEILSADQSPIFPGRTMPAPLPSVPTYGTHMVSRIPTAMQQRPELLDTGVPTYPLMPVAPAGQPAINAAAQSVVKTIIETGNAGITFETNGIPNSSPTLLNLQAGSNITLKDTGNGNIQISAAGSQGFNPNQVSWLEDFATLGSGSTFSPSAIYTQAAFGNVGFTLSGATAPAASGLVNGGIFPFIGYVWWANNSTVSSAQRLVPALLWNWSNSTSSNFHDWQCSPLPLLDYAGWQVSFIFKLAPYLQASSTPSPDFQTTKKAIYVGLHGINPETFNTSNSTSRPYCFIGVRFDTSATSPAISDTNLTLEIVNNPVASGSFPRVNTQGTTKVTQQVPTVGTIYRLDITSTIAGTVTLTFSTLNGTGSDTLTGTMPNQTVLSVGGNFAEIGTGWLFCQNEATGSFVEQPRLTAGTKITFSGITTANFTQLNGQTLTVENSANTGGSPAINTVQCLQTGLTNAAASILNGPPGAEITFNPALYPGAWFGNDDTASPTAGTMMIQIDKIFFNWA